MEQVTKINEYGLKGKSRWARGKEKDRINRQWDTNKGINFDSIKQIRPGDIYCKNDNYFKIAICNLDQLMERKM